MLLLDEPTSYLDIEHQLEVMHLLSRLHAGGLTIVTVLHDLLLASRFAHRVVAMRGGCVILDGPTGTGARTGGPGAGLSRADDCAPGPGNRDANPNPAAHRATVGQPRRQLLR